MRARTMHDAGDEGAPPGRVRIDKWLWAARFFKTRSLAAESIDGGKVEVNGERAKRSRLLQVGDQVRLRVAHDEWIVEVRDVAERRGSATDARRLYDETGDSRAARERAAEARRLAAVSFDFDEGRPSKKDRRDLRRLRGRG